MAFREGWVFAGRLRWGGRVHRQPPTHSQRATYHARLGGMEWRASGPFLFTLVTGPRRERDLIAYPLSAPLSGGGAPLSGGNPVNQNRVSGFGPVASFY